MKYKILITELTHDDLVTILSDASYSNSHLALDYDREEYAKVPVEMREGNCLEDKCADILLNGGFIVITDMDAEGVIFDKNGKEVKERDDVVPSEYGDETVAYKLYLNDIYYGMGREDAKDAMMDLIKENDDMYTGYNLIQCALFGEIIYG